MLDILYLLDSVGIFFFALSGILTAIEKKLDVVGSIFLGFITALGGGTLRDVLIGSIPVSWLVNQLYFVIIFFSFLLAVFMRTKLLELKRSFFIFDTIGIGVFTILGIQKSLEFGLSPIPSILMGTVSATFGGVLRDLFTNEIPLIFRKEIYFSACFMGGIFYLFLIEMNIDQNIAIVSPILFIAILRILAIKYNWTLILKYNSK